MAEGARLESVYTATYRGFESLSHRHKQKAPKLGAFFMRENYDLILLISNSSGLSTWSG